MKHPMKKTKLLVMVVLLVSVLILPTFAVSAAAPTIRLVGLGDSIGYGYSAVQYGYPGYNDLLANAIGSYGNSDYYKNLSVPGMTSTTILPVINGNITAIRKANIITVSIGSNNLLGPVINAVAGVFGVDRSGFASDAALYAALGAAIKADPNPQATFSKLLDPTTAEGKAFIASLNAGVVQFYKDWPVIVGKLKLLNPRAKILVNTLYNPAKVDQSDPFYSVSALMDVYMLPINTLIRKTAKTGAYKVVEVGPAFAQTAGVISFNISSAIIAAQTVDFSNQTDVVMNFIPYVDPHPTIFGHMVIFNLICAKLGIPT